MGYATDEDPYLDAQTGVLKNKAGITNAIELEKAEANITVAAIAALKDHPVAGDFDLDHLIAIHQYLFARLYPWAGELRTVEMVKGTTRFANTEYLVQSARELFGQLKAENWLIDLDEDQYVQRLAHYYSEVNVLHPFREGNGRTQRVFFSLLVARSGRDIAWDRLDPEENIRAVVAAYDGDESELAKLLRALIIPENG